MFVDLLNDGHYESAVFKLLGAEHDGAGFLVDHIRGLALMFLQYNKRLGHRRPSLDDLDPAFHIREVINVLATPFWAPRPREGGNISDGVIIAGQIFTFAQALIHNPVQSARFIGIALNRIFHLLCCVISEMVGLAEHGANISHLEHEPLQGIVARAAFCR